MEMETTLLGGKGGWRCADLNDTHCTVINSECQLFLQLLVVKNHTPPILTLKEPYPLRAGQTNVEMINLEMRAEIRMSAKLLD